jgi:hypothetical protein
MQILSEARANITSETAIRELEKKITAKMFAREPMPLRSTIKEEIEKEDPKGIGVMENFGTVPSAMTGGTKPKETIPAE